MAVVSMLSEAARVVTKLGRSLAGKTGMRVPPSIERMLKPAEAAAMLGVDPETVTEWANDGLLAAVRTPGTHREYRETEVRAVLGKTLASVEQP
jgi:excisionase family DNA binding protein